MGVADLEIQKYVDLALNPSGFYTAGLDASWEIVVTNLGPSTADDVVVEDLLSEAYVDGTIFYFTDPSGTCDVGTPGDPDDPMVCYLGDLAIGDVVTITVGGDIDPNFFVDLPLGLTPIVDNAATVSSDSIDPDNSNNLAYDQTDVVAVAELEVSKVAPATVVAGETIEYGYLVTNLGPTTAEGVYFWDYPDTQYLTLSDYSIGNGEGTCFQDETWSEIQCYFGDMEPNDWRVVYLTFDVDETTPYSEVLTNTVFWGVADYIDLTISGITVTTTTVDTDADLEVIKTASTDTPVAGEQIKYTVTVTNYGPSTAVSVMVSDTLPVGAT